MSVPAGVSNWEELQWHYPQVPEPCKGSQRKLPKPPILFHVKMLSQWSMLVQVSSSYRLTCEGSFIFSIQSLSVHSMPLGQDCWQYHDEGREKLSKV